MNTCIACTHWSLKSGDPAMARMGFAHCTTKKLVGHTVSARANACERFAQAPAETVAQREAWLAKQEARK